MVDRSSCYPNTCQGTHDPIHAGRSLFVTVASIHFPSFCSSLPHRCFHSDTSCRSLMQRWERQVSTCVGSVVYVCCVVCAVAVVVVVGGGLFRPPAAIFRSLYFLPLNLRAYVIVVFGVRARWDVSSSITSDDVPVPANKNTSLLLWFFVGRLLMSVSLLPVTSLSFVSDWCSTSSLLTSPLHPHPHTPPSCCCRCYISSLGLIFPICYFSATDTYASLSLAAAPMCLSKDENKDGSNTNVEDAS